MRFMTNSIVSVVFVVFCVVFLGNSASGAVDQTEYYKLYSLIEYNGKTNVVQHGESFVSVDKEEAGDDSIHYIINMKGVDGQSFYLDKKSQKMSQASEGLQFFQAINNRSLDSIKVKTKDNIGKTWKTSFNLSGLSTGLASEVKFTLTAMELESEGLKKMVVVRALSEPFTILSVPQRGVVKKLGAINCRYNAFYLFDSSIENVFVSGSMCTAETKMNGYAELVRYETASYKTDSMGKSINLAGIDGSFAKFVQKVGLSKDLNVGIKKSGNMPAWIQSGGLRAVPAVGFSCALACEGAANPVAPLALCSSNAFNMQALGQTSALTAAKSANTSNWLSDGTRGFGGMELGGSSWTIFGMEPVTGALVIGGSTVAAAGGFSGGGGGSSSTPVSPD